MTDRPALSDTLHKLALNPTSTTAQDAAWAILARTCTSRGCDRQVTKLGPCPMCQRRRRNQAHAKRTA